MGCYLKKHASLFTIFIGTSFIIWFIAIIMPMISGRLIDNLIAGNDKKIVYIYAMFVAFMNVSNLILQYLQDLVTAKINGKIAFDLSSNIYQKLKKAPLLYFTNVDSVYISSRINEDSNCIINFFIGNCTSIITNLLTIIFSVCMVYQKSPIISLLFIVIVILYIIIYLKFRQPLFNSNYALIELRNQYFSSITEQFKILRYIKINSLFAKVDNGLKVKFEQIFNAVMKNFKINYLFTNLASGILVIANVIIVLYGGMQVINKKITIGDFTILSSYFTLILNSTHYFTTVGKSYQQALVSVNRIVELNQVDLEHNGSIKLNCIEKIEIMNLTFAFEDKQKLIEDFNYIFVKGNIYCIFGANGSGKSTLLSLIINLITGSSGNIFYNSTQVQDLDMYYLREKHIAYCDQTITLISGTIYENLTLGLDESNHMNLSVEQLCEKFGLHEKIISLHEGYASNVNSEFITFSGGEKAKLAIIRAILKNPSVLIMDEPTAAFDKESVEILKSCLLELKKDKIIILISHDHNLSNFADDILHF